MLSQRSVNDKCKLKTIGAFTRTSGEWWGSARLTLTFNVKNVYAKYDKLTIDDFVVGFKWLSTFQSQDYQKINSKSYDAKTGVLTVILESGYNNGKNFEIPIVILDRYGL